MISNSEKSLSYKEVESASREVARGLIAAGIGKGSRIGLLMSNSPDWVINWFAALRIGALVTGVSTFLKPPELAWLIRFSDIDTLLMEESYLQHDYVKNMETALPSLQSVSNAPIYITEAPYLRSVWVKGSAPPAWANGATSNLIALGQASTEISDEVLEAVESEVSPADLAVVIFTSGSVARPKGVVHYHGTIVKHAYTMHEYSIHAADGRCIVLTPFFWIGGMLTNMLNCFISGTELICPEQPDPASVIQLLRREQPEYIGGQMGQLTAIQDHPDFQPEDFHRLTPTHNTQRRGGLVGTPTEKPLELIPNSLGMSETFGPHSGEPGLGYLAEDRANSFGRAIGSLERKIVSPDSKIELPSGETGELMVRGYTLMHGYYKKERTECFEPDGFFLTGDLCSMTKDGHLFFQGRGGEMVKTNGANVSPREVELALADYPDILESAVVGVPDAKAGELVVAVVITQPNIHLNASELRQRLDAQLSSYKIPKHFITHLDATDLPRTDSGKIQKRALREQIIDLMVPGDPGSPEN